MRVRLLDANGDMTFGQGSSNYTANTPYGVGQCVATRLGLIKGEWFLNTSDGTDYDGKIRGRNAAATYDGEIKRVILGAQGVASIVSYSSILMGRKLTVTAQILTVYSVTDAVTVSQTLTA